MNDLNLTCDNSCNLGDGRLSFNDPGSFCGQRISPDDPGYFGNHRLPLDDHLSDYWFCLDYSCYLDWLPLNNPGHLFYIRDCKEAEVT